MIHRIISSPFCAMKKPQIMTSRSNRNRHKTSLDDVPSSPEIPSTYSYSLPEPPAPGKRSPTLHPSRPSWSTSYRVAKNISFLALSTKNVPEVLQRSCYQWLRKHLRKKLLQPNHLLKGPKIHGIFATESRKFHQLFLDQIPTTIRNLLPPDPSLGGTPNCFNMIELIESLDQGTYLLLILAAFVSFKPKC